MKFFSRPLLFLLVISGTGFHAGSRTTPKVFDTQYFYFELTSTTSGAPYYFSQVVALSFIDAKDLRAKQDSCVALLRAAAGSPDNYNDTGSSGNDSSADSQTERSSNIKHLRDSGNKVIEKKI